MYTRKRFLIAGCIAFSFFIFGVSFASAQEPATGTPTSSPQLQGTDRAEQVQNNVATGTETTRENFAPKRDAVEERRTGLQQASLDRIQNLLSNVTRRMHAAITRLENIATRLTSRAEKIASRLEVDVDEAVGFIEDAESELASAASRLDRLAETTRGTLGSANPRAEFLEVKAALRETGAHIKSAHQLLREAIAALKAVLEDGNGVGEAMRQSDTGTSTDEILEE